MNGRGAKSPAGSGQVKKWVCMLMATAGLLVGCQTEQKPEASRSSVLDVGGPPQGYPVEAGYAGRGMYPVANAAPQSTYQLPSVTPPPQPIPTAAVETQTPAMPAASSGRGNRDAGGQRYTVKAGDTLYHIAKVQYGDGKQWQRIASANPGITPTSLKVGQVLVMP
jgi:nucleoid-associated protein YgaU